MFYGYYLFSFCIKAVLKFLLLLAFGLEKTLTEQFVAQMCRLGTTTNKTFKQLFYNFSSSSKADGKTSLS